MSTIAVPRVSWKFVKSAVQAGFLVVVFLIWEVLTRRAGSVFFPPPSDIFAAVADLLRPRSVGHPLSDAVTGDLLPSVGRMAVGWGIAVGVGVLIGLAIGLSRALGDFLDPVINFLRSTPGPALLPVFLILAGSGSTMRISLICFGAIWPILLNTIDGVRAVDPTQIATSRMFGLSRWGTIRSVLIPSSMPRILAGMHVGMTLAFVLMVVSELVVASNGIGYQINASVQLFAFVDMWAWIVILAILGIVTNAIFGIIERRALGWHIASHQQQRTHR